MISVEKALQILEENIPQPKQKMISLQEAQGCCLGEEILAPENSPRYTNSAMDGYAVRFEDCQGAAQETPIELDVIGESQAGIPFSGKMTNGTAIRISTGAVLPKDADTVVRVEDTEEKSAKVLILTEPQQGKDVRQAGEEFKKDSQLFKAKTKLGARELALLASVGITELLVYEAPLVSLLVTGTELAKPDDKSIQDHQIRDSNSIMLESAVSEAGAILGMSGHVEDNLDSTVEAIKARVDSGDTIILCSGGVSVGRHDHVKDAAQAAGFKELFWKIKQKPGKPLFVGKRGETLLFGLPGNPVSAFMCFTNYVRPLIAKLMGNHASQPSKTAKVEERVANNGKRTNFVRVTVEDNPSEIVVIKEAARQGSHMLSSIVHADGYIILQPGEALEPGDLTEVFLF